MELRQLRHALALAEIQNYARAAEHLCITQPALTRSIQTLEQSLGVVLFNRSKRSITLTPEGESVVEHAKKVVFQADSLKKDVALRKGLEKGRVDVGLGPYVSACYASNTIAEVLRKRPTLDLKLVTNSWDLLLEQLLQEKIDFFIADVRDIESLEAIEVGEVVEHLVSAYCRSDHPLPSDKISRFAEVTEYPCVAMTIPASVTLKTPGPRIAFETNNIGVIREVVKSSDAVCFLSEQALSQDIENGALRKIEISDSPVAYVNFGLVTLKGRRLSEAAKFFLECFRLQLNQ